MRVDRRTFLAGSAALGLSAACGGGDSGAATPSAEARSGRVEFLVPTFPDGFLFQSMLAPGLPQRVTFVVRDDLDVLRADAPDTIDLSITLDGEEVAGGEVAARSEGIITPYYPVEFTPERAGEYLATVAGADPVPFLVVERSDVPIVQVGERMRSVATPTVADHRGVDPICTRAVQCPFHQVSLDEAISTGRPVVLLVATPGFCQTDICGPVVDLLIEAVGDRSELSVVHGEVYVDPSEFATGARPETTAVVQEYRLPYEPQLLIADETGIVVARLDTIWDRSELDAALAAVA